MLKTESVQDRMHHFAGQPMPLLGVQQGAFEQANERALAFIKEYPNACLLGALAAGLLAARIVRAAG